MKENHLLIALQHVATIAFQALMVILIVRFMRGAQYDMVAVVALCKLSEFANYRFGRNQP